MARASIPDKDLALLVKLLGMLGSDNPHERAAFGARADAWVRERGLTWEALLLPAAQEPARGGRAASGNGAAPPRDWASGPAWGPLVADVLVNHPDLLRGDRELSFLESQLARAIQYGSSTWISEKQELWLRDILGRAGLTW